MPRPSAAWQDCHKAPDRPQPYRRGGAQLKQLREQTGCSRATAARQLGVPLSRLYDWEEGFDKPESEQITKLCAFYQRVYEVIKATGGVRE